MEKEQNNFLMVEILSNIVEFEMEKADCMFCISVS